MNRRSLFSLCAAAATMSGAAAAQQQAPKFEVDMLWPKPMPNRWLLGSAVGVAVDSRDHVFVVHRTDSFNARTETGADATPPVGECCRSAPAVLEYDPDGNLVGHWGGPGDGYSWPVSNLAIAIDPKGNVWIGGGGGSDTHILKFTREGKYLATIGKVSAAPTAPAPAAADTAYQGVSGRGRGAGGAAGAAGGGRGGRGGGRGAAPALPPNSTSMEMFGGAAGISFDAKGTEAFIADGLRNHRVAVVDVESGAIKRYWGAYGSQPSDAAQTPYKADAPPSKQFSAVTCAEAAKDGMVYVCDRNNNRIQVFKSDGSFVKEKVIAPKTVGDGAVWDLTFSRDAAQKYIYVADGLNQKIWILDRNSLDVLTSFGEGGRVPGEFYAVHSVATDSKGNLYTVESLQGKRLQKFNFKGVMAVPAQPATVVWPRVAR